MQHKLLTPEQIAVQAGSSIPHLYLPQRGEAFAGRAARLRTLAPGHAIGPYLELIALVADAQQALLERMPPVAPPSPAAIAQCREHGMPPLNAQTHQRDRQWCDGLRHMLRDLAEQTSGRQREVIVALEGSRDALYEAQASKLLAGIAFGLDRATAPLIAAGLQVYFTHLALVLGAEGISRIDVPAICPCCGSRPTASVVRIGGAHAGYRFLHCALCSTEWHMVRVKCAHCESTKGIDYASLDDGRPAERKAVQAEVCGECGSYLKICYMDRDPHVEPVADDLASLALDLLVTQSGKDPAGVNYMLLHGDPGSE